MSDVKISALVDISVKTEILVASRNIELKTSVVYSNSNNFEPFDDGLFARTYTARQTQADPVFLCQYPSGTLILAESGFVTYAPETFVIEQLSPWYREDNATPALLLQNIQQPIDIHEECILVARYGEGTWGHWLAELLPRCVLAERAYPGRFRYVVPAWTTTVQSGRGLSTSVNESLRAYGISPERLIRIETNKNYRFSSLYGVSSVWSNANMHPDVMDSMRNSLVLEPKENKSPSGRVALLRRDVPRRNIKNIQELEQTLIDNSFQMLEMAEIPFLEQVALFRDNKFIFSVLGSALTSVIYSPNGVKILSAGPANWPDSFFYSLIRLRKGWLSDVRGVANWTSERFYREAPFSVEIAEIERGLEALGKVDSLLGSGAAVSVAGIVLPLNPPVSELEIDFSKGGNSKSFLREGWSGQEAKHIWCIGPISSLVIQSPLVVADYILEVDIYGNTIKPYISAQKLIIIVNGTSVGTYAVSTRTTLSVHLPKECFTSSDEVSVQFVHPNGFSGQAMGRGEDSRLLSVAFLSLRLHWNKLECPLQTADIRNWQQQPALAPFIRAETPPRQGYPRLLGNVQSDAPHKMVRFMNIAESTYNLIKREPISALASTKLSIFEAQDVHLPHVCVYENVKEFSPEFSKHLMRDVYIPRLVSFPAVDLVTLPPGTTVHGDHHCVTTVGNTFVEEQFHPVWHPSVAPHILSSTTSEIHISEDALLLGRFGDVTWGHWLGELVPRAVMAEIVAPGKYRFVVPSHLGTITSKNFLHALHAYGIGEDRLIRIDQEHRYVFNSLATVSSMWIYPYAMQPAALSLMRNKIKIKIPIAPKMEPGAAIMRRSGSNRFIENISEVSDFLRANGFAPFEIGSLPFIEQVAIFQQAHSIFGELGSNLTGLIYSPLGVKTVSVAPGAWGDCFFHGIMQALAGKYADVRGTPNPEDGTKHTASFTVSTARIAEALEAVGHK